METIEDYDFQQAASGASDTAPHQVSSLRKNGYVMLKGKPCQIVEMTKSKPGKHGHAKIHLVGLDVFTGRRYEDFCPSSHNMMVPEVKKREYTVIGVSNDGFFSLLDEKCEIVGHLRLGEPLTRTVDDVRAMLERASEKDEGVTAHTICALGEEKVRELKITK